MTIARAIRLATEAIKLEVKRLAFDANVLDKLKLVTPESVKASKRRRDLLEAISILEALKDKQAEVKQRLYPDGETQVQIKNASGKTLS